MARIIDIPIVVKALNWLPSTQFYLWLGHAGYAYAVLDITSAFARECRKLILRQVTPELKSILCMYKLLKSAQQ